MRVGIDAHKTKCTTVMFDGDSVTGSFDFQTTRHGVYEFMEKVPEGSIAVIEPSTTGKVLSRMLSGKYEVHMVAPPERKVSIKTDRRDAERIVMEDMLNYPCNANRQSSNAYCINHRICRTIYYRDSG
jgi:transposase